MAPCLGTHLRGEPLLLSKPTVTVDKFPPGVERPLGDALLANKVVRLTDFGVHQASYQSHHSSKSSELHARRGVPEDGGAFMKLYAKKRSCLMAMHGHLEGFAEALSRTRVYNVQPAPPRAALHGQPHRLAERRRRHDCAGLHQAGRAAARARRRAVQGVHQGERKRAGHGCASEALRGRGLGALHAVHQPAGCGGHPGLGERWSAPLPRVRYGDIEQLVDNGVIAKRSHPDLFGPITPFALVRWKLHIRSRKAEAQDGAAAAARGALEVAGKAGLQEMMKLMVDKLDKKGIRGLIKAAASAVGLPVAE